MLHASPISLFLIFFSPEYHLVKRTGVNKYYRINAGVFWAAGAIREYSLALRMRHYKTQSYFWRNVRTQRDLVNTVMNFGVP